MGARKICGVMLIAAREGTVEPDYFQFYLSTGSGTHAADQVSGTGYETHLEASAPGFIYVGTLKKYSETPIRLEVHDTEPGAPSAEWQHVVDVSINGDGGINVLSWPADLAFAVPTPVGPLRVRAKWAGLDEGLAEGLREDGSSDEHLELQIWPSPHAPREVVRWWKGWRLPDASSTAPDGREQIEGVDEVVARIQGRMRPIPVLFDNITGASELPGGGGGFCSVIWGDPADGSWWADGYAARRVLRPVSDDEVRKLIRGARPMPRGMVELQPDPRFNAMLRRVGLEPQP
jgi:hypothetical protein